MKRLNRFGTRTTIVAALCALAVLVIAVSTVVGQEQTNPDDALPDDVREATYQAGYASYMERRDRWIRDFEAAGRDILVLPRSEAMAIYAPGTMTLGEALQLADVVAEGIVTDVVYTPSGTIGTIEIAAVHKISLEAASRLGTTRPTEVQVALRYSPEPDPEYATGRLVYPTNQPLLLPGSRTYLFLQASNAEGRPPFYIQSYTGGYEIDEDGQIVPVPANAFADQVRGLTTEMFTSQIVAALAAIEGTPPVSASPVTGP